ncbi:M4 family metallopeptidase [Streptomyces sp. NPDC096030]|uniref:M4 family metallopeptidase n=1 Tax=Streptomyces sp. NPDC096030 TaxID=3155423 RepID=UPI00332E762A
MRSSALRSHRRRTRVLPRFAVPLITAAAVLAALSPAAPASASARAGQAPAAAAADDGALPAAVSPAERHRLLRAAAQEAGATRQRLGLGPAEELRARDAAKDRDGTVHMRYERTYAGLPVLGGDLVVHQAAAGSIRGVSWAHPAPIAGLSLLPRVSAAAARQQALATARARGSAPASQAPGTRKVIWAAQGTPVLAFETAVRGQRADGTPSDIRVITSAHTGAVLFSYDEVHTGTGNTQYSGTVPLGTSPGEPPYTLTDTGRGNHRTYNLSRGSSGTGTLFSGPDDTWGNGQAADPETAGADAHYGAAATWDYLKNVHARNGLRNDGTAPYSRVHYGSSYVNAFWQDSCFCMTYGDGAGNAKPLTSMDVAAHEMTHGLTSVTARLVYSGESGGLNEATSDIMAAAVEFATANTTDTGDYLVGEKIDIRGNGTPLRYMDRPSRDGISKDSWYPGIGGIDVHYSSGPANHWFYLASEGSGTKVINGVTYDSPTADGLPVTPAGREAAEKIWFRALTVYMTSNTSYAGARTATLQAAADLYGAGSPVYTAAANAWAAVNVGPRIHDGVTVTPPPAQYSLAGQPAQLTVQASSTNPGPLAYTADGLPDGLSISPSDGRISGTPDRTGRYTPTVTVTDSAGASGTATFTWTVEEEGSQSVFENTDDYPVTDNATTESPLSVNRTGPASSTLAVDVRIIHTWRGDLVIDLIAPDQTAYRLKDATAGDSADDVTETYTLDASSRPAAGVWKLRVQDTASQDTGYIDSWKLTF